VRMRSIITTKTAREHQVLDRRYWVPNAQELKA